MAHSTPSAGPANRHELPCYHYPSREVPRPVLRTYDNVTMNSPAMPCMYILESFLSLVCDSVRA